MKHFTQGRRKEVMSREKKKWGNGSMNLPKITLYIKKQKILNLPQFTPYSVLLPKNSQIIYFNPIKHIALMSEPKNFSWVFDCEATDTMTYEPLDLLFITHSPCTKIQTTNGVC